MWKIKCFSSYCVRRRFCVKEKHLGLLKEFCSRLDLVFSCFSNFGFSARNSISPTLMQCGEMEFYFKPQIFQIFMIIFIWERVKVDPPPDLFVFIHNLFFSKLLTSLWATLEKLKAVAAGGLGECEGLGGFGHSRPCQLSNIKLN